MPTISSALEGNKGIGPGFDFLRLMLALLILFWHCFALSYGVDWSIRVLHGPFRLFIFTLVPSFFALSGFLVAGSLMRIDKLHVFLLFRVLRILPALVVETLLSAFVLGAWATIYPLRDYFKSPQFMAYMLNILGFVQFQLPGVFEHNPWPNYVNFSLWTLPAELSCYILLSVLMLAGIAKERVLLLAIFLLLTLGCAGADIFGFITYTSSDVLSRPVLVSCFAAGNLFYLWGDRIRLNPFLMVLSIACYSLTTYYLYPFMSLLGSLSIAYITIYVGLHRIPKISFLGRGDYSYGIYLYSYPIQQTVVWLFPNLREFYFVFFIAAPFTILFAMFSWHCIEKPVLSLRKIFMPKSRVYSTEKHSP